MSSTLLAIAALMSGPAAGDHGCHEAPHHPGEACECTRTVDFYGPWTPGRPWPGSGWGPPVQINGGGTYHVQAPGVRVRGRPIEIDGPVVHIQGPPVYVDAPPIRVRPAQIYVQRPDVRVRPSEILVEPPAVHFAPCPDGGNTCPPAP